MSRCQLQIFAENTKGIAEGKKKKYAEISLDINKITDSFTDGDHDVSKSGNCDSKIST